jgi:hypothetical protein
MPQAPSSTHSFHWREHPLVARAYDLGPGFGATLNLSHNGWDAPVVIFFDSLEYCTALAAAINGVAEVPAQKKAA